jgi:hypothetical protein
MLTYADDQAAAAPPHALSPSPPMLKNALDIWGQVLSFFFCPLLALAQKYKNRPLKSYVPHGQPAGVADASKRRLKLKSIYIYI